MDFMERGARVYLIRKLFQPEIFQGKYKRRHYFEGWYFKLISQHREHSLAVIPGISLGSTEEDRHAFIQLIDGSTCQVDYFRYDISDFGFDEHRFWIKIGDSVFSDREMTLHIDQEGRKVDGQVTFSRVKKLERSLACPGIMGPFGFLPFMECYHGIVNAHHELTGHLMQDGATWDFSGGYGYVEKDWGRSFPEAWFWLQCNHFDSPDVSLMLSVAKIPFLGQHFMGLISFLRVGDKEYRFATYTGAKLSHFAYEDGVLTSIVEDKKMRLQVVAEHSQAGLLQAPKNGMMTGHVYESIGATVQVRLADFQGNVLFEGGGIQAGMEIVDAILPLLSA